MRALAFVVVIASMTCACLLTVSTSGLSGGDEPLPDTFTPDVVVEAGPNQATDAGDAHPFVAPDGSTVFAVNGHAYQVVVVPKGLSWYEARDRSIAAGGHLATIGSAAENQFVKDLVNLAGDVVYDNQKVGPWLGGYQPVQGGPFEPDGGWVWLDDTPWSFTDWLPDQPDNSSGTEGSLVLYRPGNVIGWNDEDALGTASVPVSYVVEFE